MGLIERKDRERAPESERERWSEIIGVQWGKREIKKGTFDENQLRWKLPFTLCHRTAIYCHQAAVFICSTIKSLRFSM
jgi:hypothetical protein